MSAFPAADIILFGIQAGVRLYGQARQAYIERTRERALTLPFPGIPHEVKATDARLYFGNTAAVT